MQNCVWLRSPVNPISQSEPSVEQYEIIIGSEGADTYQLTSNDINRYISFKYLNNEIELYGSPFGPVLSGPPRLLDLKITGIMQVGQIARAEASYLGGIEGASEFWWIRVKDGRRESLRDPSKVLKSVPVVTLESNDHDPRIYHITEGMFVNLY